MEDGQNNTIKLHISIKQEERIASESTESSCIGFYSNQYGFLFFSKQKREQDRSRSSSTSSPSSSSSSSREEKECKKERDEEFKPHHEQKEYSGFTGVGRPRGTFVSFSYTFSALKKFFSLEYISFQGWSVNHKMFPAPALLGQGYVVAQCSAQF